MEELDALVSRVRAQVEPEKVVGLARALLAVPSHTPEGEIQAAGAVERFSLGTWNLQHWHHSGQRQPQHGAGPVHVSDYQTLAAR